MALVDPGPSTCLATLEGSLQQQGIGLHDVTHVLLTHIHLDHAGVTGTLVRRYPGLKVLVHERGAVHLVDPTKLLQSATRLYGDRMDRLWETAGARGQRRHAGGGERRSRRAIRRYTPGHAYRTT